MKPDSLVRTAGTTARSHQSASGSSSFQYFVMLVEVDGGLYVNGGHTRGAARERDYERDAEAMLLGFRVLRVSPRQVKNGKAIAWITALLK